MAGPSSRREEQLERRDSERGRPRSRSRTRSRSRSPERTRDEKPTQPRSRSPHRRSRKSRHSRSRSGSPRRSSKDRRERHLKRRRSNSRSGSSGSSSDSDGGKRKKRHKEKRRKRDNSEERERRKDKKDKKKKKKKDKGTIQWGKYGILSDTDLYNKEQEFRSWLVEEQMINPENLSKEKTKKQFAIFVENYNTATLPHEKYYNMEDYERRMTMVRNGELVPKGDETYDIAADLRAHDKSHKKASVSTESYLNRDQLQALRRVQNERVEVSKMKVLGLDVKSTMGVRMDGSHFDE